MTRECTVFLSRGTYGNELLASQIGIWELPFIQVVWVVAKKVIGQEYRICSVVEYLNPIHIFTSLVCKTTLAVEFIHS